MIAKILITLVCAFVAYLVAGLLHATDTVQLVVALLVGVLVWVYGA